MRVSSDDEGTVHVETGGRKPRPGHSSSPCGLCIGQHQHSMLGTGLRQCDGLTIRGIQALVEVDTATQTFGREMLLNGLQVEW